MASKKKSTFSYLFIWLRGIMWYESKMVEHSTAWPMHIYFPLYDYRILTAWICVIFWKEIREVRKKLQTFPNHRKNTFYFFIYFIICCKMLFQTLVSAVDSVWHGSIVPGWTDSTVDVDNLEENVSTIKRFLVLDHLLPLLCSIFIPSLEKFFQLPIHILIHE